MWAQAAVANPPLTYAGWSGQTKLRQSIRGWQRYLSLKDEELTIFRRRKIGFVFQAYNLVPVLNVYENIVLPIELDGGKVDKEFVKK